MRFVIGLLGFLGFGLLSLEALSLPKLLQGLPPAAVEALLADKEVYRLDREHRGIEFLPRREDSQRVEETHKNLNPDVMVEALYLIPYPQGSQDIDLTLYNALHQVSKLDEVVYLSKRQKGYTSLFTKTSRVDKPPQWKPLEDKSFLKIPEEESIFFKMVMTPLGKGYYQGNYWYNGDSLMFSVENISVLRLFFKVVDKNNLRFDFIFWPTEQGYLVYAYCGLQLTNAEMVYQVMDAYSGFYKRLYAIEIWLYNSLFHTQRKPEFKRPLP